MAAVVPIDTFTLVIIAVIGMVATGVIGLGIRLSRLTNIPLNQAGILTGMREKERGFRIIRGERIYRPFFTRLDRLDLDVTSEQFTAKEILSRGAVEQEIEGKKILLEGVVRVDIEYTVNYGIGTDNESITKAATRWLSKQTTGGIKAIEDEIKKLIEFNTTASIREIAATMTPEELNTKRLEFEEKVVEHAKRGPAEVGIEIVKLMINHIKTLPPPDKETDYWTQRGRPIQAVVMRDAEILEGKAHRDSMVKTAEYDKEGKSARYQRDAEIAEAEKDKNIAIAGYQRDTYRAQQEAQFAGPIKQAELNSELLSKSQEALRAEQEAMVKVKQQAALVAEQEGDASKKKAIKVAEGDGEATKRRADGTAYEIKVKGEAEGEAIRARLEGEAKGKRELAEALKLYDEQAQRTLVISMYLDKIDKVAEALVKPLMSTEKVVILGGGEKGGFNSLINVAAQGAAALPTVVDSVLGEGTTRDILSALTKKSLARNEEAEQKTEPSRHDVQTTQKQIRQSSMDKTGLLAREKKGVGSQDDESS